MKKFLPTTMFSITLSLGYSQRKQSVAARDPIKNAIPFAANFSQEYLAPVPVFEFSPNLIWAKNPGY